MPVLLSEKVITLEFSDLYSRRPISRPPSPPARSPGKHQSGILAHIARKTGVLKPNEPLEDDMPWIMAIGVMWEEFAASLFPDMDWQPGELTVDEVSVNCDGLSVMTVGDDNDTGVVDEFKATYKKVRTGEEFLKEWMWMHQGRAYCHCYGPRIVRWHILFIKGDYERFGPVVKEFVVWFTDKEVEQTWKMLMKHKGEAEGEGEG